MKEQDGSTLPSIYHSNQCWLAQTVWSMLITGRPGGSCQAVGHTELLRSSSTPMPSVNTTIYSNAAAQSHIRLYILIAAHNNYSPRTKFNLPDIKRILVLLLLSFWHTVKLYLEPIFTHQYTHSLPQLFLLVDTEQLLIDSNLSPVCFLWVTFRKSRQSTNIVF